MVDEKPLYERLTILLAQSDRRETECIYLLVVISIAIQEQMYKAFI